MADLTLNNVSKQINEIVFPDHDFVPTIGGRGQHHPRGLLGNVWQVNDPKSVHNSRYCEIPRPIAPGDMFLCVAHSGDCFQDYILMEERDGHLVPDPDFKFGSYGIGDATVVDVKGSDFNILKAYVK